MLGAGLRRARFERAPDFRLEVSPRARMCGHAPGGGCERCDGALLVEFAGADEAADDERLRVERDFLRAVRGARDHRTGGVEPRSCASGLASERLRLARGGGFRSGAYPRRDGGERRRQWLEPRTAVAGPRQNDVAAGSADVDGRAIEANAVAIERAGAG